MATKLKVSVRFGVVPHKVLYSKDLSMKAKGLFAYIQSKPDGWEFSADRIAEETKEERKSIQSMMKELEKAGYLIRRKSRTSEGKWFWEHQLVDEPLTTVVPKADSGLFHDNTEIPEVAFPPTVNTPIKKEGLSKKENTCSSSTEETTPFSQGDWVLTLSESPQPHIRLIAYYFGKYLEHNFPTKEVANDELKKNLKPAMFLVKNYEKKDISKTLRFCQEKFSDVHWNLHTVKKQISYVTAKQS